MLIPSPQGDFLTQMFKFLMGILTGPVTLTSGIPLALWINSEQTMRKTLSGKLV